MRIFNIDAYQLFFGLFAVCVVGGLLGFKMAVKIYNPTLYILFWAMYFITFLCLMSLLLSLFYYDNIKVREGPKGLKGNKGPTGEIGDDGVCKSNCRDAMFYYELLDHCNMYLNKLENTSGKPVEISNKYWKDRLTMIVSSKEFTNLMMVQGRESVMKFIKETLEKWMKLLHREGGRLYFESIGAENEFDWRKVNPWDEIKKYDMYYWGMNKMFRIMEFEKCRPETVIPKINPELYVIDSNEYELQWGHKRNLGRSHTNNTFWYPKQTTQNGRRMYPLGDVFAKRYHNQKTFSGQHARGHIKFNSSYDTGPGERTFLVGGNVARPVGTRYVGDVNYRYCKDWLCRISRYRIGKKRRDRFHLYELVGPPGYKCLGYAGTKWGTPDLNNYRCLPEKCLKRVHYGTQHLFSADGDARHVSKLGSNQALQNRLGNLYTVNTNKDMYEIKEECLKPPPTPKRLIKEMNEPTFNKGWHPKPPSKDKKYSVMNYLSLPTEAILVNKGNPKVYVKVRKIQGKEYNKYHIIQYEGGAETKEIFESKLQAINIRLLKWKRGLDNYDSDTFRWVINNNERKNGELTIVSEAHNQYLRMDDYRDIRLVNTNQVDKYAYWMIR